MTGITTNSASTAAICSDVASPHARDPIETSFMPLLEVSMLLAAISADATSLHAQAAAAALDGWRDALATPERIAAVDVSDDLQVDDAGAGVSVAERGSWAQCWRWVRADA